jgi:hypothetical protein
MSMLASIVLMDNLGAMTEAPAGGAARKWPVGVGTACPSIEPSILLAIGD